MPGGRLISNAAFNSIDKPDPNVNTMFVAFAQFLDHDLDMVPIQQGKIILID